MNNMLQQLNENVSLNSIKSMKSTAIANAYVANYIAALTIIRAGDEKGMKLLNDKAHTNLKKFSSSMSRPNFWGFIVFNSDIPNIKKLISPDTADELAKNAGRIVGSRRQKLQNFTTLTANKINWTDAAYSIKLLKVRFELPYSKLDNIANGIYAWDSLDEMSKGDLLYNVFSFLMQCDNESDLLPRLRALTNNKYLTVNSIVSTMGQKLNKVFRMFEDEILETTRGGFGGSASQAAHEIEWIKRKIKTLEPKLAKTPRVAKQIKDLERQIRERELAIALKEEGEGDGEGDIGTGPAGPGVNVTTPDGTSSKDVGTLPYKFDKGKIIKRRKRNWKVRKWKDPSVSKKIDSGDYSNVKIN